MSLPDDNGHDAPTRSEFPVGESRHRPVRLVRDGGESQHVEGDAQDGLPAGKAQRLATHTNTAEDAHPQGKETSQSDFLAEKSHRLATRVGDDGGTRPQGEETTQRELLAWGTQRLATLADDEGGAHPHTEARTLLAWVLGVDSLFHAPTRVTSDEAQRYRQAVDMRRDHTPLAHITGHMFFRGLTLISRPGAFIVRPETEIVVERALEEFRRSPHGTGAVRVETSVTAGEGDDLPHRSASSHHTALLGQADRDSALEAKENPIIVDLCTGSGAIALACAREIPESQVYAVELSPDAARVARENIALHARGNVHLVEADATDAATLAHLNGRVHLLVTNPPYVPADEAPTQPEAQRDPDLALYGGGEDGTLIPVALLCRATDLLAPQGCLVMEHSPSQSATLRGAARALGFTDVRTETDFTGTERMLIAHWPGTVLSAERDTIAP